jgi:histidine ammonia-lyase
VSSYAQHTNLASAATFPPIFPAWFSCMSQVKSFEADVVEAQGYKGAIAAADELKGLLEGSKAVGSRKGLSTEQQAAYSSLPQVRTDLNATAAEKGVAAAATAAAATAAGA